MKKKPEGLHVEDLSFPPSYSEQAKYLLLADKFLSSPAARRAPVPIDSSKRFQAQQKIAGKTKKAA